MPEVLTVEQQFGRLHSLIPASEPALWQTPEFQEKWVDHPPIFDSLTRYSAGSLSIGDREIGLTFLNDETEDALDWRQHIPEDVAAEMIKTLQTIASRWGDLGALEEVSVCVKQPMNPENKEPANGYSPTAFIVDEPSQHVTEVPSGSIILFPHALKSDIGMGPYRGAIKDLPHIAGVIAHEWSHQFMSSENTELFQEWVKTVPGWKKQNDTLVAKSDQPLPTPYSYNNPTDDFVESLVLYLLKPELLQTEHPERYQFCDGFAQQMHAKDNP